MEKISTTNCIATTKPRSTKSASDNDLAFKILSWLPLTISNLLVIAFEVPVPLAILFTSVAVNYSNFVLNPIIYALRFPEFKQALDFCCHRSHDATMNVEGSGRKNNIRSNTSRISEMQTVGLCCCRLRNSMNTCEGGQRNYRITGFRSLNKH